MDEEYNMALVKDEIDLRLIQPQINSIFRTAVKNQSTIHLPKSPDINYPAATFYTTKPSYDYNHTNVQYLEYFTPVIKLSVVNFVLFILEFFTVCCSFLIIIRSSREALQVLGTLSGDNLLYHPSHKPSELKFLKTSIVIIMFAHTIQLVLGLVCFYGIMTHERELIMYYLHWTGIYLALKISFLGMQVYYCLRKGYKHMTGIMFFVSFAFIVFYVVLIYFMYMHYKELEERGVTVFEKYQFFFNIFFSKK